MKILTLSTIQVGLSKPTDVDTIGKLRYQCYLSSKAIERNDSKSFLDNFDTTSNSLNLYAENGGKKEGLIRGVILDKNHSNLDFHSIPSLLAFEKEIKNHLGLEKKIYESCRFSILENASKKLFINFALIKANIISAYANDCEHIVTAVREKHVSFYEKMGMETISKPKNYPGVNFKTVLLAGIDVNRRFNDIQQILEKNYKVLCFNKDTIEKIKPYVSI